MFYINSFSTIELLFSICQKLLCPSTISINVLCVVLFLIPASYIKNIIKNPTFTRIIREPFASQFQILPPPSTRQLGQIRFRLWGNLEEFGSSCLSCNSYGLSSVAHSFVDQSSYVVSSARHFG